MRVTEESQLLKGILEGCVLSVISRGETYGYEILSKLNESGFENLIEGTLYPVLKRLQKKGFISCRIGKSPLGPSRKYFSITGEGMSQLKSFTESYERITGIANRFLLNQKEEQDAN